MKPASQHMKNTMKEIVSMAIVQRESVSEVLEYGKRSLPFPVAQGEWINIDETFLSGKFTKRLKHINVCLKLAGKDTKSKADKAWFNKNVRDGWHKALRYANRQFLANGKPVSIGITERISKAKATKGDKTTTAKFGFEIVEKAKATELADASENKAVKTSKERARRQSRKGLNNGLAKLDIVIKPDTTPTPEQTPTETVTK